MIFSFLGSAQLVGFNAFAAEIAKESLKMKIKYMIKIFMINPKIK